MTKDNLGLKAKAQMDLEIYKSIFDKSPIGYAYFRIIRDPDPLSFDLASSKIFILKGFRGE